MLWADIPPGDAAVIAALVAAQVSVVGLLVSTRSHAKKADISTNTGNGVTLAEKVERLELHALQRDAKDDERHSQNLRRLAFLARRQKLTERHLTDLERTIHAQDG